MLMTSAAETAVSGRKQMPFYPELAGKRVLITGVSRHAGADLATALADHKARLIVNFGEESAKMQALAELIAPSAMDLAVFHDALATVDDITGFTRSAAKIHGGLDAVINLVHLECAGGGIMPAMDAGAVEAHVSAKLLAPCLISRIAANRMALTWSEGVIINAVTMARDPSAAVLAVAGVTRATLAAMTRRQAGEWAGQAVRINAIAPDVLGGANKNGGGANKNGGGDNKSTPDKAEGAGLTALALYLASKRSGGITGQVFNPDGMSIEPS